MNKLKRIIIGAILTTMMGTVSVNALNIQTFSDSLTVYLNNIDVYEKSENKPLIINDRTVVPLRPIFEAMGWEVEYDDTNGIATFSDGKTTCSFKNEDSSVSKIDVNGTEIKTKLDVPAMIYNGNFYIPIRAFCELWSMDISWNDNSRSVYIEIDTQNKTTKTTPEPTEKPNPTAEPKVTEKPNPTVEPKETTKPTSTPENIDFDLTYEDAEKYLDKYLQENTDSETYKDIVYNSSSKTPQPMDGDGELVYEFLLKSKSDGETINALYVHENGQVTTYEN